ncbi:LysR family transcriptional regulator [Brenneria goodwinii]|uniref:LysR substrate-binding domain-containing protein n=1 Tax=Brenneria goodwinii TaxID=1109412 RepID=UPI000F24FE26|nr:LysR substrate-binding domain-containing protein [Brenneria goodwinii]MCG8159011.1 LysR family transcriptional regulator [Brenneria goodwinii]MCG8161770.1 LysR family transcriptional regulator [Brenneria goodwinii]MCG8168260.1 LysR family transcriptional regulator [Brenneria goodwinii]MCG8172889.1 LysR family transcriptional regulator [Brenneria goodwinii]MCG8175346.1 LysR family transcriptional regulator [Brenneria goodwinii]
MIDKRKLPLSQLRAFEAAGRLGGFKAAAIELGLTQSAVSHHVRFLEETIGRSLFVRGAKSVQLTAEGLSLLQTTSAALDSLTGALNMIAAAPPDQMTHELTLAVPPSFATRWLLPRINRFQRQYPFVQVNIVATMAASQEIAKGFDAAIIYDPTLPGEGAPIELEIFREITTPVCSPSLIGTKDRGLPASRISEFEIIFNTSDPWDWNRWCDHAGINQLSLHSRIAFDNDDLAIQSALACRGIVLPELRFIEQDILERRLVIPFSVPPVELGSYRFVPYSKNEFMDCFYRWLQIEVADFNLYRLLSLG